ncbi:MAG: MFS transporter [Chloroflexi bacterium]|jgi:predicted MFS family arabinose efflux permease|nr:MFS transporter [Chloroflexota bacterium]
MKSSLRFQIILFAIIRLVFNTIYRMVYPFLAVFSRGLGVDLMTLSLAMTNRSLVGMLGAFLATISDRWGRKTGMLFGIILFVIGAGVLAIWPSYPGFVVMLILTTLGKYGFDPAMQAYLGDRIPYERRGLALSATELGWSLSFFIGIPLVSLLIDRQGWQSPFVWLALAGISAGVVLVWLIPHDPAPEGNPPKLLSNFGQVLRSPLALAALSVGISATVANEVINLIFGVWMEASFDLKVLALGGTAAVIGVAEFIAEILVGALADRFGKARAIAIGLIANSIAALAFPLLGGTLPGALISLFLFFITFEFMLVSSIPMMTEIMPGARATLMAFNVAGLSLGRAIGAFIAPSLFDWGIAASAGAAILFNLLALGALRKVRRQIS